MKAILCDNGDLEVILKDQGEILELPKKILKCEICGQDGVPAGANLEFKYNNRAIHYKNGIRIDPKIIPFTDCGTATINIDVKSFDTLSQNYEKGRIISTSLKYRNVCIYLADELAPFFFD